MTEHGAHDESLSLIHFIFPKIALGMTGVPISSKQALEAPSGGGIHYEVSFTSGSFNIAVKFFFQYWRGLVTKHPFPDIGLKQKLSTV